MKTAVQRWGNSLALRIPRSYAMETRLSEGSEVDLSVNSGALLVRPIRQKSYALADLLAGITPKNRHAEVSTGKGVGRESW